MQNPSVSVIVTTYNREELLKETLQSILNQTFTDFELIVVDNFSSYNFFEVIEGFGDVRIHPFQNANNGIIAVNRNFGILKARGRYLAFCDDDDLWMPEKLERQMEMALQNNYDLVSSDFVCFGECDKGESIKKMKEYRREYEYYIGNRIALSSVLLKLNDNVFFSEDRQYVAIEDYCLWLKLHLQGFSFHNISTPLIKYRIGDNYSRNLGETRLIKTIMCLSSLKLDQPSFKTKYFLWGLFVNFILLMKNMLLSSNHE